jgi:hypothetical protein
MNSATKNPLVFLLKVDTHRSSFGPPYVDINALVQVIENGNIRTPGDWVDDKYAGLAVAAHMSSKDGVYGQRVVYRDLYELRATRAQEVAKVLVAIERKLQKMDDELGAPQTFPEYLLRAAKALGIKKFVVITQHANWQGTQKCEWYEMNATRAQEWVQKQINDFLEGEKEVSFRINKEA